MSVRRRADGSLDKSEVDVIADYCMVDDPLTVALENVRQNEETYAALADAGHAPSNTE